MYIISKDSRLSLFGFSHWTSSGQPHSSLWSFFFLQVFPSLLSWSRDFQLSFENLMSLPFHSFNYPLNENLLSACETCLKSSTLYPHSHLHFVLSLLWIHYILITTPQWGSSISLSRHLPGESHGSRSLVGCSPWGHTESDVTERLHFHFSLSCLGKGNGNPL